MKRLILSLTLALLAFNVAQAKEAKKGNKGIIGDAVEPSGQEAAYGMSGCGLGSVLFGESESTGGQVLSSTTNGIYSNNTFGMSSGTSNCVQDNNATAQNMQKNMENFVAANRQAFANDVAKSNGETLIALSSIMGCQDTSYFGSKLQAQYETIFKSQEEAQIAHAVYSTVSSDRYLVENCKL